MKFAMKSLPFAIRSVLTFGLVAPIGLSVSAQEQEEAREGIQEEVLVTGTRIKGLDLGGAVQAVQFNRDDIATTGAVSAADLMKELTQTGGGSGTFTTAGSGPLSGSTPPGAGAVSLRGLGTSSTLTLINGRRAAVSSFANGQESFIDINSIPASAIERVEVLPSGASAIYGADAVAGVVNIILRDDYEGAELSVSYGDSEANTDEGRYNVNFIWGAATENTHSMLVVDYYNRNAFYDRDRSFSANSVRPSQQGIYPSFNDLYLMLNDQTEEPADGGCPADQFGNGRFGEFCELNQNAFSSIEDEYESLGVMGTFVWNINETTEWRHDLMFQTYETRGASSPANFSRAPIDPENPLFPDALVEDIVEEGLVDDLSAFYGFPIYAWGKFPDARAVEIESSSMRYVSELTGVFDNDWDWELGASYGRSESDQRGLSGLYVSENFYDALLGNLCTDGSRVERWDVDLGRPDASYIGDTCEDAGKNTLWYNPFGGQTQQMDGIDELVATKARREGKSSMWSIDGVVSGAFAETSAGSIMGAVGFEYRHESVEDVPDGVAVSTTLNPEPILGFSSTSSDADRDQWAVYAEVAVPLSESFELQLAGRYDHYDNFGGDFNPKVAIRWGLTDTFVIRSNWSTSFRAPSLAQAGAGTLLSSYSIDCGDTPEACDGDALEDGRALLSEDVSNPGLEPETADTYGFGFYYTPTEDIELSVDYWNIQHKNLVGIDEDDFIRRALAGDYAVVGEGELPTGSPGLEVVDGFVVDAHFELTNLGFQDTDGVDMSYTQYFTIDGVGDFRWTLDATYVNEFVRQASDSSEVEQLAGDYRYPRWLANSKLRWRSDAWTSTIGVKYTHSYRDDPSPRVLVAAGFEEDDVIDVDSWIVANASISYDFANESYIQFNIDNLFDEEPPLVLGSSANVDLINHSSMGRFYRLSYTHVF